MEIASEGGIKRDRFRRFFDSQRLGRERETLPDRVRGRVLGTKRWDGVRSHAIRPPHLSNQGFKLAECSLPTSSIQYSKVYILVLGRGSGIWAKEVANKHPSCMTSYYPHSGGVSIARDLFEVEGVG